MTAGELAVVLAAVLCCIGFAALIVVLLRVLDTMQSLRAEVVSLRQETGPLLAELRASTDEAKTTMAEARDDLERFDRVLGSAEAISGAVAGSGRVARVALEHSDDQDCGDRHGHDSCGSPSAAQGRKVGMIKRMTWFVGGAVAGVAGASIAKKKVKQAATHLAPRNVVHSATGRVRDAVGEGRRAMRAKETGTAGATRRQGDHARRRSR